MSGATCSESFGAGAQSAMDVYDRIPGRRMFAPGAELLLEQLSEAQWRRLVEAVAQTTGDGAIDSQLESNIAIARRA